MCCVTAIITLIALSCSRVHFGMNGSLRINPSDRKDRTGRMPALQISLTNDLLCFFDTTVEIRWPFLHPNHIAQKFELIFKSSRCQNQNDSDTVGSILFCILIKIIKMLLIYWYFNILGSFFLCTPSTEQSKLVIITRKLTRTDDTRVTTFPVFPKPVLFFLGSKNA